MSAFLFDLDGVLVETREVVIRGWRRFAASRGRAISDAEIAKQMFGRRTFDILVDEFGVSTDEADALAASMADKSDDIAAGPPLREIAGAPAFVRAALGAGIRCAVASSASAVNVRIGLTSIGLGDTFDIIVDAGQVERGKPAPDAYLLAARRLGTDPAACVVFEDTRPGIEAGLAAGARVVGIATQGDPGLLERAHLVIPDFVGHAPGTILLALDEAARTSRSAGIPG